MKPGILLVLLVAASIAIAASVAHARSGATKGVRNDALAAAGRAALLGDIDYGEQHCDGSVTVAAWLKALVGGEARGIEWRGGSCQLTTELNPLDRGGDWCAQAFVTLAHPKSRDDTPVIEIYFEKPDHGRPGRPYAFRGVMMTRDGGPDYSRFRQGFEAEWRERFPSSRPPECRDPGE
ncbi:MAG: hypothetical protein AB7H71_12415 [Alphaproteobacteria bacterium]